MMAQLHIHKEMYIFHSCSQYFSQPSMICGNQSGQRVGTVNPLKTYEVGKPQVATGATNVWALQEMGKIARIMWCFVAVLGQ
jgi:hypothetical protein